MHNEVIDWMIIDDNFTKLIGKDLRICLIHDGILQLTKAFELTKVINQLIRVN